MNNITFDQRLLRIAICQTINNYGEIAKKIGRSSSSISYSVKMGDIGVRTLLSICNAYRIDIKRFFVPLGSPISDDGLIVPKSRWHPIVFHEELISNYNRRMYAIKCSQLEKVIRDGDIDVKKLFTGGEITDKKKSRERKNEEEKQFVYNTNLFKLLPTLISVHPSNIGRLTGHTPVTYLRYVEKGDCSICVLVDICNTFHVPINFFFVAKGSEGIIPQNLVVPEKDWEPIKFNPEIIKRVIPSGCTKPLTVVEIAKRMNVDRRMVTQLKKADNQVRATFLARVCNELNVDPVVFFCAEHIVAETTVTRTMQAQIESLNKQLKREIAKNNSLTSELIHLESTNKILNK